MRHADLLPTPSATSTGVTSAGTAKGRGWSRQQACAGLASALRRRRQEGQAVDRQNTGRTAERPVFTTLPAGPQAANRGAARPVFRGPITGPAPLHGTFT